MHHSQPLRTRPTQTIKHTQCALGCLFGFLVVCLFLFCFWCVLLFCFVVVRFFTKKGVRVSFVICVVFFVYVFVFVCVICLFMCLFFCFVFCLFCIASCVVCCVVVFVGLLSFGLVFFFCWWCVSKKQNIPPNKKKITRTAPRKKQIITSRFRLRWRSKKTSCSKTVDCQVCPRLRPLSGSACP